MKCFLDCRTVRHGDFRARSRNACGRSSNGAGLAERHSAGNDRGLWPFVGHRLRSGRHDLLAFGGPI